MKVILKADVKGKGKKGEIVNVSADQSVLDEDGKIDPDKLRPITFDPIHNAYRVLSEKVGNAFKDGAKLK